jgi:hypothetical protein
MEKYKVSNLYNTVASDLSLYTKAYNEIAHIQKKQKEFGAKLTSADDELIDRLSEVLDKLESLKNQLGEMNK